MLGSAEVARLLDELGRRSALRRGNPYRAKAYRRAAESLLALPTPLHEVIEAGELRQIPGVGNAIADIIGKLAATGTHPTLEAMRRETPTGLVEIAALPGMRPERAIKLQRELGIETLDELERAARSGKLAAAKGFGPAFQRKVLQAIDVRRGGMGLRHLHRAADLLESAAEAIRRKTRDVVNVQSAGDLRRGCELVRELAIVTTVQALDGEPTKRKSGDITLWLTDEASEGATLLYATGSSAHLEQLEQYARQQGLALTASGLSKGRKHIARTEAEIYTALGLQLIPPELREGTDEIVRARNNHLPKLVQDTDIRGILHAHTNLSDGVDTLEVMAEAVRKRGYEYFGIADHSQSARYAGGLTPDEILAQHAEIDRFNRRYGKRFRIFKGIESDILRDGSLDYPDEILQSFDFVVASVHGQFALDVNEQTERILQAVANPFTTILGHMTGRQLLRRPGYEIDVDKILRACAKHGVAVEINANPWRLDLDWRWHQRALSYGCMMAVNPDAHSVREIDLTRWGVKMARKGGVPKEKIINTFGGPALSDFFRSRRGQTASPSQRTQRKQVGAH